MPTALLVLFALVFSISAFVVGPAISGDENGRAKPTPAQTAPSAPADDGHASHH